MAGGRGLISGEPESTEELRLFAMGWKLELLAGLVRVVCLVKRCI